MSAEVIPLSSYRRPQPSDLGNAERLVARHGTDLHYVPKWGKWIVWDGRRWAMDETGRVERLAKDTVRAIYEEAAHAETRDESAELAKHALKSEANGRIVAMLERARVEEGVPLKTVDLDADAWRLAVWNGTVDLRTAKLGPHVREHLITKLAPVVFNPGASCPRWHAFLTRVLDGDAELVDFVQRAVGYSLTGDTREQCLFFLHGSGANGKSTFLEVLRELLGEYAYQADIATFLDRKTDGGPRNDVAGLVGARLVTSSEVGEGKRFNESLVKHLTGGDTISARFLYQEAFEFAPAFKLWIAANHKPVIRGADDGIWRRLRLVPFTVSIPVSEQDQQLREALRSELAGILAWAVEGCQRWLEDGLRVPKAVRLATAAYRSESDVIGSFLDDCCEVGQNFRASAKSVFESFSVWAKDNGHGELSQQAFGRRLSDRGIIAEKAGTGAARVTYRIGVRLLESKNGAASYVPKREVWEDRELFS